MGGTQECNLWGGAANVAPLGYIHRPRKACAIKIVCSSPKREAPLWPRFSGQAQNRKRREAQQKEEADCARVATNDCNVCLQFKTKTGTQRQLGKLAYVIGRYAGLRRRGNAVRLELYPMQCHTALRRRIMGRWHRAGPGCETTEPDCSD